MKRVVQRAHLPAKVTAQGERDAKPSGTHTHTNTHTHTHTHNQIHTTHTHRHTDTQTHRHTDTHLVAPAFPMLNDGVLGNGHSLALHQILSHTRSV